ncbi:MAG: HAD-IIIA family hydrolase [Anaerolineae bacterium]|nr:HAD-IIIA family hydrolase [Anaerolineae bacterium]
MKPAIFLDRDGVIIENRENYIRSCADVIFIPGALSALRAMACSPFKIVVITNQSVIGRGLISLTQGELINEYVLTCITEAGGRIDAVFMCPHTPDDYCDCRKPQPGLIMQAASALELDLRRSYLVGDALSDIVAGRAAGVMESVLIRTGRGATQEVLPEALQIQPLVVFDSLAEAFDYISVLHV